MEAPLPVQQPQSMVKPECNRAPDGTQLGLKTGVKTDLAELSRAGSTAVLRRGWGGG